MDRLVFDIEGMAPLLFNRMWSLEDDLLGNSPTKTASSLFNPRKYFTSDYEKCFQVDQPSDQQLKEDEIDKIIASQIKKSRVTPAIPMKHWLDQAMFGAAGQVKSGRGRSSMKDFINSTFAIIETRIPIGTTENLFHPIIIDRSLPSDKRGARHYVELPGFEKGWTCHFTIQYFPDLVSKVKIRELIEIAGWMKGIGARRKAGNGKFIVTKMS